MSAQTPIATRFGHVVTATQAAILADLQAIDPLIEHIHYQYGHPLSIINTLTEMDNSTRAFQFKKYPLVALFMDFPEDTPVAPNGLTTATVQIVIATQTIEDKTPSQRYATSFSQILYPIYEELMRQLAKSPWFFNPTVSRTKTDRPFWGKEGLYGNYSGVANDFLDAVETKSMKLIVPTGSPCSPYELKNF